MRGLRPATLALFAAMLSITAERASATGYAIREQSGGLLGQAFAGQNAWTADPSVIFFNPAGMSALEGTQTSGLVNGIFPQTNFHDHGSTTQIGLSLGNDDGGDAGENAVTPAFYGMTSYGDLRLGLGINAPFGLQTSYNHGWIGRFAALDSKLQTININPALSYRITRWLALGAGVQIQHAYTRLTNSTLLLTGEGESQLKADDWGVGWTAGALIQPMSGTTIGIGWRSSINHDLQGDARINAANGTTVFSDNASANLQTPQSVGLSLRQAINQRLTVSGTVEWTNWSDFDEIRVKFEGPTPDKVTKENWDNTWFFSLGLEYLLLPNLTLRTGVAYDESPVRTKFRTARLPDNDRTWLAVGATYRLTDAVSFDLGYSHVFVKEPKIDETYPLTPVAGGPTGNLHGHYESSIDLVALQANLRF